MFWAPQGRQAGCWHGAEPCGYPTCCRALAAAAGAVSFDISPLVIGTHVILSSAAVGQVLHCSVPVLLCARVFPGSNAEPLCLYHP